MKKKFLSVVLVMILLLSSVVTPAYAADEGRFFENLALKAISTVMNGMTGALNGVLKEGENFVESESFLLEDFYCGTEPLLSEKAEGARWSLGYDYTSLIPENMEDYKLYLGGFIALENGFINKVKGVYDDMAVRTVALSDGSGRGVSVFATVDSIGLTNRDIRTIRSLLADLVAEKNINSINIFSTHTHSVIDTQGLWTQNYLKIPVNIASSFTDKVEKLSGTDENYMRFLFERVSESIEKAVSSMKTGEMTFAQKDIGEEYFKNKNRDSATALMTDLSRFCFVPDDNSTPTIMANMSAHADVAGLPVNNDDKAGNYISGDYIYYIGETLNQAGYNFMFFNGAVCGIYIGREPSADGMEPEERIEICQRYGREIGKMLLSLSKTEEEIRNDPFLSETGDSAEEMEKEEYTLWYENWKAEEEKVVEPLLNVNIKSIRIPVTNNVIKIAAKLGLINHTVLKENEKYFVSTEIGTVQLGNIKAVLMPGEICQDLVCGGNSLTAEGSYSGESFEGKTVYEIFGEDVLVFGLANDTLGYVVPDNDYVLGLTLGHYHELLSPGKSTASALMAEYEKLA